MRRTRTANRWLLFTAVGAATTLALTACAGSTETPSTAPTLSDEPVTLSFTWWGNDVRHEITEELIAAFEAEHENITIEPQYTDWAGYWDKLSTSVAAGDTPDIIQMDEKQLSTYADNGVLLDLGSLGSSIDTANFPESVLGTGALDGVQYGIPVGINTYTVMANLDILESLGIEAPDDETWSWEDLADLSDQVSAAGAGSIFGIQGWGFNDGDLNNWLRQHGDALYNAEGEIVADEKNIASFWQYLLDVTESGGSPEPSATIERQSAGLAESFTATNQVAFGNWWSNQVSALRAASGQNLAVLQLPTPDEGETPAAYYKPSMFWSASAKSEHPAEVALFLEFLANSEEAADLLLAERGVPANDAIREYITPKLDEVNQEVVEFLDLIEPRVGDAPSPTPPGGGSIETIISQHTQQVLFGEMTPEEAAASFVAELQRSLDDAAL